PERKRAASAGRAREHVPWSEVLAAMRYKQMIAFFIAQFMASFTRGINMGGMLQLYATYTYGIGPATIGLMASGNSLIQLPLGFVTGYVMDRWGRKRTIVPRFSLLSIAMMFM